MKNPGYKDGNGERAADQARIVWWRSRALAAFGQLEKTEWDREQWRARAERSERIIKIANELSRLVLKGTP